MKTNKLLITIVAIAIIVSVIPTMTSAHSHFRIGIGIGIGVPIYGGCGYWEGPMYYPYYPCYPRVVYAPPPYYPPIVVAPPVVVVAAPPVAVVREAAITSYVNVPNSNGSIMPVRIRHIGNVWIGPKGEQYLTYPTVEQLKPVYGFLPHRLYGWDRLTQNPSPFQGRAVPSVSHPTGYSLPSRRR